MGSARRLREHSWSDLRSSALADEAVGPLRSSPTRQERPNAFAMINVLIADAHPVTRNGLVMMIERLAAHLGHECVVAFSEDALTAFRKAKRLQPDLIVLSAPLPLATGVQAVLALREHTPHAKLAILRDDDDSEEPEEYRDAGADAVLRKGQSVLEIEAGLEKLLRSTEPRRGGS